MATVTGKASDEIAAPLGTCWDLLVDAGAYPAWYGTLDEVVVEETDDQGRPRAIRVRSDVGSVGSIRFRLELTYEDHTRITATQTGHGDLVKDVATEWVLEAVGPRRTRATYRVSIASEGLRAAAAFRAAEGLVRRALIDGFVNALKARAEQPDPQGSAR
jgi:Polyketide cyclase / dehydrase and lipid transport